MMRINLLVATAIIVFSTSAFAHDKTIAIVGHTITQAIQGNDMNHQEVLTNELQFIVHQFSLDIMDTMVKNLPVILEGVSATVRLEVDDLYKCSLQGDYKNKDCR